MPGDPEKDILMKKRDILLVDDDKGYLHLLSSVLRLERFDVATASNGSAALELLENENTGLLITDFNMPGMDGLELASCVRERYPEMTVFMITASILSEILEEAVNAGIANVFSKPLDMNSFLTAIRSALYLGQDKVSVPV